MIPPSYQSLAEWQRLVALNVNPILTQYMVDSARLTYSGNALKLLRVNSTADGVELSSVLDTVTLAHAGAQVAATSATGIDLSTGMALKVGSSQVVAARKTGWAVDTGTAKRTANATYAPGSTLTFSATYVQAEHTAVGTRLATIETALRDATRTIKALKDDLHATAGHGLIGT